MTPADFLAFYPQFTDAFPALVLETYVTLANARFDEFAEDAEEARRLYVAHKLTLYAKTQPALSEEDTSASFSSLASAGDGLTITSKRVENVAVTYASGSSSSASSSLADLSETEFGKQLLSLLRLFSYPRYVP